MSIYKSFALLMMMKLSPLGKYSYISDRVDLSEISISVFTNTDIPFSIPLSSIPQNNLTSIPAGDLSISNWQPVSKAIRVIRIQRFIFHSQMLIRSHSELFTRHTHSINTFVHFISC